ncbi:MAG: hypothetical protein WAZ34_10040 [Rhodocyclaceae bacterium]
MEFIVARFRQFFRGVSRGVFLVCTMQGAAFFGLGSLPGACRRSFGKLRFGYYIATPSSSLPQQTCGFSTAPDQC